ncbi:MAG: hypothetical protein KF777_05195 [Planctomycetaceae bacterium]|nr:hypothetical protein [Planctomycetaceae bacterium]
MAKWHFKPHDGYGDISQSSSAEAFEGSAIKDLATSVVRESVQNVLDVTHDRTQPARVRFTVVDTSAANTSCSVWFDGLMRHLQLPGAGVPDAPKQNEPCRYLLIEDFNTSGLVGDYKAPYVPGTENNFVNFLYHDGLTGKIKKLGSRGVGKIVLLLASRARAFFAYTNRVDDPAGKPLLVGKSLLKFRQVGGVLYDSACYFVESWDDGKPREPVASKAELARFREDFTLSRSNESGLSVVIPYLDPSITLKDLRRSVVEEYHFAILNEKLVVELSNGSSVERIDADHIPDVGDEELSARVALAQYALTHPEPALQTMAPAAGDSQKLSDTLVPEAVRGAILDALNQHERIAVRCRLHIHPKDAAAVETWCDVYFESVENVHQRPVFMRELLPISGEGKPCSQLRSLVLIRPGPLADLLRAAEGANHTQWSPRTDNFKRAYKGRLGEIEFVSTCVNRLVEIARGNATEPVGGISTFFFSAPLDDEGGKSKHKGKKKPGSKPEKPDVPDDDIEPVGYLFNQEAGGFTLRGHPDKPVPKRITVRVAYDVIRGSAWSDYDPDDFDLRKPRGDVRVVASNADIERPDPGNRLIIKPTAKDFEVAVTGFNEQLDVIVDHRSSDRPRKRKGEPDAGETLELHQPQQTHA